MARPRTTRRLRQTGAVDPPPVGPDPIEPPVEPARPPDITRVRVRRRWTTSFRSRSSRCGWRRGSSRTTTRPRSSSASSRTRSSPTRTSPASRRPSSSWQGGTGTGSGGPPATRPPSHEAREWLAGELGPYRAIYVAYASRPTGNPPKTPTPPGKDLVPPLVLRSVPMAGTPTPGQARLLPLRWAAFVEVESEVAGPFWSAQQPDPDLPVSPALVDLPPAPTRRASWTRRTSGGRTTSRSPSRRGWSSGSRSRRCRTGRPRDITVCSSSASRRAAITARR